MDGRRDARELLEERRRAEASFDDSFDGSSAEAIIDALRDDKDTLGRLEDLCAAARQPEGELRPRAFVVLACDGQPNS